MDVDAAIDVATDDMSQAALRALESGFDSEVWLHASHCSR
jgi:hypothetical protein